MFPKKPKKSELPDKTPYTIYNPHTTQHAVSWVNDYYQVLCIDPGITYFGFRIERRYISGEIIPIVFIRKSMHGPEKNSKLHSDIFNNITLLLDEYSEHYKKTHIFIIERQLAINYKRVRVEQHIITYFMLRIKDYPLLPMIVEIDPKVKTKQLDAPPGLSEKQVKTWSIQKARDLLIMRDDNASLKIMDFYVNKQDDLADTVCTIEGIFKYWNLPVTKQNLI